MWESSDQTFGSEYTEKPKVEAPVKFLYTAPSSDTPKAYPFSALGLGDGKHRFISAIYHVRVEGASAKEFVVFR